jgi:hypothetical protein
MDGYELASIPHVGDTGNGGQDEFDSLEMDRYSELHILQNKSLITYL